jgi:hypothetical protein
MPRVTDPRQAASLYRRIAAIPTSGGASTDRMLLRLAEMLDRDALTVEQNEDRLPKLRGAKASS